MDTEEKVENITIDELAAMMNRSFQYLTDEMGIFKQEMNGFRQEMKTLAQEVKSLGLEVKSLGQEVKDSRKEMADGFVRLDSKIDGVELRLGRRIDRAEEIIA